MHLKNRPFAWLLGACAVLVLTLLSSAAAAQSLSLNTNSGQPEREVRADRGDEERNAISYADCLENDAFTFQVFPVGASGTQLQVWAGTAASCTEYDARYGDAPQCWLVYEGTPGMATTWDVRVRVQDIVAANTGAEGGPGTGTADDCAGASDGETVNLTFMLVNSRGELVNNASTTWSTVFDLSGPPAPTGLSVGVAESRLHLSWDITTSSDTEGYRFYCVPAGTMSTVQADAGALTGGSGGTSGTGGSAAAPLAGAAGSAGAAGGSGASATTGGTGALPAPSTAGTAGETSTVVMNDGCPTDILVPGEPPSAEARGWECGRVTQLATAEAYTNDNLANNQTYAVAIAAYDDLGNVGDLSEVVCGTPRIVDDFFEIYRRAGGKGGGGFCAVGADPTPGLVLLLGAGLIGLIVRRRQRRA